MRAMVADRWSNADSKMPARHLIRSGGIELRFRKHNAWGGTLFLIICLATANVQAGGVPASLQARPDQPKPPAIELITAEELKAKTARNEPVTIIDVRNTAAYAGSDSKIKGAFYVRLRRLRPRLAAPPLKDVPRTREAVTYCACANDEASFRAAEVLLAAGFTRVRVLKGGWQAWLKAGGPREPKPKGV